MARKSNKQKTEAPKEIEAKVEAPKVVEEQEKVEKVEEPKPTPKDEQLVDRLMRLYPHMETMWITREGFVHSEGVPEHYRKNAKLYKNKYYKK